MFAETCGREDYYLFKAAGLPTLTPVIILEIANYSWRTKSLDKDPSSLRSALAVLNFYSLPVNPVDYKQCINVETRLAISRIE